MALLKIEGNEMFDVDVTTRESDEYTKKMFLKFELNYNPDKIRAAHEMFLTPAQMDLLGRFLIREAAEVRTAQGNREVQATIAKNKDLEAQGASYRLG